MAPMPISSHTGMAVTRPRTGCQTAGSSSHTPKRASGALVHHERRRNSYRIVASVKPSQGWEPDRLVLGSLRLVEEWTAGCSAGLSGPIVETLRDGSE